VSVKELVCGAAGVGWNRGGAGRWCYPSPSPLYDVNSTTAAPKLSRLVPIISTPGVLILLSEGSFRLEIAIGLEAVLMSRFCQAMSQTISV